MGKVSLEQGALRVEYEPERRALRVLREGRETPWEVDLGQARVRTAPRGQKGGEWSPLRLEELVFQPLTATRAQWLGTVGGAEVALEVGLEAGAVICTVTDLARGRAVVTGAVWPGRIEGRGSGREIAWSGYNQGHVFRADGEPWAAEWRQDDMAMRWLGLTAEGQGLAIVVETPMDAVTRGADDGEAAASAEVEFVPALGELRYARRLRLIPLGEGGHVALAKAFRRYAQGHGLWLSWEERVARKPVVERLLGAFVACAGYWRDREADHVGVMRRMREYGFERGYLFSPRLGAHGTGWHQRMGVEPNYLPPEEIAAIEALGYLTAPFLQAEEADASAVPEEMFARDEGGGKIQRWQIGETRYYEIAKDRALALLPALAGLVADCSAVHFDTLTAMPLVENWGGLAYDRRGDAALRRQMARYFHEQGKLICAEDMYDWAVEVCDLGTSRVFSPASPLYPRTWTAPLDGLVYHDSFVRIGWEHWAYDDARHVHELWLAGLHPWGQEVMDLLTCSPPVLFPEGLMYGYEHEVVRGPDGEERWETLWDRPYLYTKRFSDPETQAALPKALRACELHRRHGVSELVSHRWLPGGEPYVQETEYASGLRVVANFGDEPWPLPGGGAVPPRSAVTEE